MAKLFNKEDSYKIRLEINKDEVLKDIREIKKETETIIKDAEYNINKLRLKRKDILVIKVDMYLKQDNMYRIEKELRKRLHRKVLVFDRTVTDIKTLEG